MATQVLNVEERSERGTKATRRLRRVGRVPAVVYGHKQATVHVTVIQEDFVAVLRSGARMVDVRTGDNVERVLIKDVQFDPLGDEVYHVDFVRVAMDEAIRLTVPLELHGTAAGVKTGGVLDQMIHEIEIECLPADIPEKILVHVDAVETGQTLRLGEIPMPKGVKPVPPADTLVISVHLPLAVAEPEVVEEGPVAPEVIKKEKPEEEEEAEGEPKA